MQARAAAAARRGTMCRVDGATVHMWGCGVGEPTVVISTGAGVPSLSWLPIIDAVAEFTSVVIGDRPGYGRSSASTRPRTPEQAGRELEEMLDGAGVSPPFVLVGHSIGGLYMREYARRRPETVAGIVLVDSSHEQQVQRLPRELADQMQKLVRLASSPWKVAALKPLLVLVAARTLLTRRDLPWPTRRALFAQQASLSTFRAGVAEAAGMSVAAPNAAGPLPAVPLVVLVAGRTAGRAMRVSPDVKARARATWLEMQDELAAMSPRSTLLVVEDSGHMIPDEKPQVVIDAVRSVVDEWRRGDHRAQGDAAGFS